MALWDDITKNFKDVAALTMKKTEDLTNVAKLKLAIHSEESKLDKCYAEIGSLYYDFQRKDNDHAAEIAALLLEADELNTKVDALKKELAALQNSVICKECGAKVAVEYDFCPSCGKKISYDEPVDKTEEPAEDTAE